jgi:anti-sigma B factor antagonist
MDREPVEFNVRRAGDGALLEVAGGLDAATAPLLIEHVNMLLGHGVRRLRIDLRAVDFIDSRGIAALIHCRRRVQNASAELELVPGEGTARRLLDATGLAEVFSIEKGD